MLNIEEILKISDEMGIDVSDGTSGKHYILDGYGRQVEFNTDMIIKARQENVLYKFDLQGSEKSSFYMSSNLYNLSSSDDPYTSVPIRVNDSIIVAA